MARKTIRVPKVSAKNDNYLSYGINGVNVGTSTGVIGTGSMCFNDYLLNGSAHISGGSGVTNRLGNKLYFTKLESKLFAQLTATGCIRVIIGKSIDPKMAQQTTNTLTTGLVESTAVLEPPLQATTPIPNYYVSPGSDYKIISDRLFHNNTGATSLVDISANVPITTQRGYDNSAAVIEGSWFIYLVATAATPVYGTIKVSFADQSRS